MARALAAVFLLSSGASACPVCFGKSADTAGISSGLAVGIFVLLAFTFAMIGSIIAAVVRVEKDRALLERAR